MGVASQVPYRHVPVAGRFDPPRTEYPARITIEQQRHHHPGGILLAPASTLVDRRHPQLHSLYRFPNKVGQVIPTHPYPHIYWLLHRRLPIDIDEAWTHRPCPMLTP